MDTKTCYLVIEDADERDLLETALRETELGYTAIVARTFERAKERIQNEADFNPDYLFIDHNLQMLNYIRSVPRLANAQVVIYSTGLNTAEINELRRMGASHVILKTTHEIAMTKILLQLFTNRVVPFVVAYPADEVQSSFFR
jgi:DNA-binding NarL/FixJ family response regulator